MNERIKELAKQATIHSPEGFYTYTQIDPEKFAELIVRECAAQAEEESSWPYSSFGKKIKKHFGVEE